MKIRAIARYGDGRAARVGQLAKGAPFFAGGTGFAELDYIELP
jgi:hypothetical protein